MPGRPATSSRPGGTIATSPELTDRARSIGGSRLSPRRVQLRTRREDDGCGCSTRCTARTSTPTRPGPGSSVPRTVEQVLEWFNEQWDASVPYDLAALYEARWARHQPWDARILELNTARPRHAGSRSSRLQGGGPRTLRSSPWPRHRGSDPGRRARAPGRRPRGRDPVPHPADAGQRRVSAPGTAGRGPPSAGSGTAP